MLGLVLLPETRQFGSGCHRLQRSWLDFGPRSRLAYGNPAIGPVILTFFLATLGFGAFEVTLALFLTRHVGATRNDDTLPDLRLRRLRADAHAGLPLPPAGEARERGRRSWRSASCFMAVGVAAARRDQRTGAVSDSGRGTAVAVARASALTAAVVGFAFLTPSAQALISRRTAADRQGEILGVNQSASSLARILGPIFGVTLYKATDSHMLPYVVRGAVLLLVMLPMVPRIRRGGTRSGSDSRGSKDSSRELEAMIGAGMRRC